MVVEHSLQQKMDYLVEAINTDQPGVSVQELCNFLEIDFNQGQPDTLTLTKQSMDILENRKITQDLDPEDRKRIIKTATEVVGAAFIECLQFYLSTDLDERLQ